MNKKLFVTFTVMILVIPQVAFASWWNPFTWKMFHKKQPQVEMAQPVVIPESPNPEPEQKPTEEKPAQKSPEPKKASTSVPHASTPAPTVVEKVVPDPALEKRVANLEADNTRLKIEQQQKDLQQNIGHPSTPSVYSSDSSNKIKELTDSYNNDILDLQEAAQKRTDKFQSDRTGLEQAAIPIEFINGRIQQLTKQYQEDMQNILDKMNDRYIQYQEDVNKVKASDVKPNTTSNTLTQPCYRFPCGSSFSN